MMVAERKKKKINKSALLICSSDLRGDVKSSNAGEGLARDLSKISGIVLVAPRVNSMTVDTAMVSTSRNALCSAIDKYVVHEDSQSLVFTSRVWTGKFIDMNERREISKRVW